MHVEVRVTPTDNLLPAMEALLPPATVELLRRAGATAAREGAALYLVGGSVRDLLLGRPVMDLDVTAEGDGPRIAEALASAMGGRVTARSQFGTAKVVIGGLTLDVATARRETYAHPGALPAVRPGTLRDDLARRDFTVNAMAAHLGAETFGAIEDRMGGGADLAQRVLRPLHDASFVDDATRILRALRYEHRLGFRMDAPTEALVRRHASYLSTISGDRVRHEFERICREARPEAPLARARDLGVLAALLPGLDWPEDVHRAVSRARDDGEPTAPLIFVALLASSLSPERAAAFADRLAMPARWRRIVDHTVALRPTLDALAEAGLRPSQVERLLRGTEEHAVLARRVLSTADVVRERLGSYATELRHVQPRLNGHDLRALGVPAGPETGRVLDELRAAVLDGDVRGRDEEEAWVRRRLGGR